MNVLDLLIGKYVIVPTDALVDVRLNIESVEEIEYTKDLEPSTRQNDFYPDSITYYKFEVKFTNGYSKIYNKITDIKLYNEF